MRARVPDVVGRVERDGVGLGYEVFHGGSTRTAPTVLLLPTWTIIHARFWKMQVPYLSRHFPVVVYDGPGNGRSDRTTDPARYGFDAYAADAAAVLDACRVDRAVVVGASLGGPYGLHLSALRPELVAGLVLVGAALPLVEPLPERRRIAARFRDDAPAHPTGWDRYNLAYWHANYREFAGWFFAQVYSEPHSTKAHDDAVSWAMESGPHVLEAEAGRPAPGADAGRLLREVTCPMLLVHGTDDRVQPHAGSVEASRISGAPLVSVDGGGHLPNVRDPVRFNRLLRAFIEEVAT